MQNNFFWNDFDEKHRKQFYALGGLTLLSLLFAIVYWALGVHQFIDWTVSLYSETVAGFIESISSYPFTLDLNSESIIFNQYLAGSDIQIDIFFHYSYLILILASLATLSALSTQLKGFWYYVASALLIAVLIVLKLDLLMIFGDTGQTATIISLVLLLGLSYYLNSIRPQTSLSQRMAIFLLAYAVLFAFLFSTSTVQNPAFYLVAYGFPIPLILTLIATVMVGHEVISSLLKSITNTSLGSTANWKHFYVISFIYLGNLILIFSYESGWLDWNLLPVSPILFFIVSYILGIWGFRDREPLYEYFMSFRPTGSLFYLAMGIISFSTIAFVSATGNDPALELIKDLTLYTQLGFGFMFLVYVTANFIQPLSQGMAVHRILYKPEAMPFFTYRFAGIIVVAALIFAQDWKITTYQAISAYYINLGDLYRYNDEYAPAIGYYREASLYGFKNNNHRSNYVMARLSLDREDYVSATEYFVKAKTGRPSEFVYVDLANLYLNQNRYFDALFCLQDGVKDFPDSGPIKNNLGLLYARGASLDSAVYYLEQAMEDSRSEEQAKSNLFAVLSRTDIRLDKPERFILEDDEINLMNRLAYYNVLRESIPVDLELKDSTYTRIDHAMFYNRLLNSLWESDTSYFNSVLEASSENYYFDRRVKLGIAMNRYYKGDVTGALQLMKNIRGGDMQWTGKVNDLLGKWYFDLGDPEKSYEFFSEAVKNYNSESALGLAMSLTRSAQPVKAIIIWDSLRQSTRPKVKQAAINVMNIYEKDTLSEILSLSDAEKYQWLLFHEDKSFDDIIIESYENPNYKARTLLDDAQEAYSLEFYEKTLALMIEIRKLELSEPTVINDLNTLELKLAALSGKEAEVRQYLPKVDMAPGLQKYFEAFLAVSEGDSATARKIYDQWALLNPFNEEMVIAAYKFYEYKGQLVKAYSIIQEASLNNPNSIRLQKEYIRYCGRTGNINFGSIALMDLKGKISEADFDRLSEDFARGLKEWQDLDN